MSIFSKKKKKIDFNYYFSPETYAIGKYIANFEILNIYWCYQYHSDLLWNIYDYKCYWICIYWEHFSTLLADENLINLSSINLADNID